MKFSFHTGQSRSSCLDSFMLRIMRLDVQSSHVCPPKLQSADRRRGRVGHCLFCDVGSALRIPLMFSSHCLSRRVVFIIDFFMHSQQRNFNAFDTAFNSGGYVTLCGRLWGLNHHDFILYLWFSLPIATQIANSKRAPGNRIICIHKY